MLNFILDNCMANELPGPYDFQRFSVDPARIQNVLSEGVQLCQHFLLFLLAEGKKVQIYTTLSEPPWARQRNAIRIAFHWRAGDGTTLNAGLAQLYFFRRSGKLRNPLFL